MRANDGPTVPRGAGLGPRGARVAIALTPAVLALGVMMPRLRSAQFGLLDDGVTIYVSRALGVALGEGDLGLIFRLELERGRFRPLYWLFEASQYAIWGSSALGFFVTNSLLLLLTALFVAATVAAVTRDSLPGLIAGVAYVLSPPVVESYYTLSKPEVPLALWLALSLYAWARARVESGRGPTRSRWWFALSAGSLVLAYFTKETAQAVLFVSAVWTIASRAAVSLSPAPQARRVDRWYLGANLALAALFWILRVGLGTVSISAGEDSQRYAVTGPSMLSSGLAHVIWYVRDFPVLLPLVAFLLWRRPRHDLWLTVVPILWILGWTARLGKVNTRIREVEVSHYPRVHGRQTGASPKVILRAFKEIAALYWRLR